MLFTRNAFAVAGLGHFCSILGDGILIRRMLDDDHMLGAGKEWS